MLNGLIGFCIFALVLIVCLYIVKLIIDALPLPGNIKQIALLIVGLIFLIALLSKVFGWGGAAGNWGGW